MVAWLVDLPRPLVSCYTSANFSSVLNKNEHNLMLKFNFFNCVISCYPILSTTAHAMQQHWAA